MIKTRKTDMELTSEIFADKIQKSSEIKMTTNSKCIVSNAKPDEVYAQRMISYVQGSDLPRFCIVSAPEATGKKRALYRLCSCITGYNRRKNFI